MALTTQASSVVDDKQVHQQHSNVKRPSFEIPFAEAETDFIKECEKILRIKPKWPKVRENLWYAYEEDRSLISFKHTANDYIGIPLLDLDNLGIKLLYNQYADWYKALNAPASPPKPAVESVSEEEILLSEGSDSDDFSVDRTASSLGSSFEEKNQEFDNPFTIEGDHSSEDDCLLDLGLRHRHISSAMLEKFPNLLDQEG